VLAEPLSFAGTLTLKDTLGFNHYLFRYIVDWPVRIRMAFMSAPIATVLIFAVRPGNFTLTIWIILFLCVYFPLGWILHRRLAVWRHYRRHRDQYIEHTVTITNDSISTSSTRRYAP
jgi:hypothetical protein